MASVNFTYALKRFYPDLDRFELEAPNVLSVLEEVNRRYPGILEYLLDDQGVLRKHVNIFVDGNLILDREKQTDVLSKDAEVYIMQALSGG